MLNASYSRMIDFSSPINDVAYSWSSLHKCRGTVYEVGKDAKAFVTLPKGIKDNVKSYLCYGLVTANAFVSQYPN